jgi:hypothetical protein
VSDNVDGIDPELAAMFAVIVPFAVGGAFAMHRLKQSQLPLLAKAGVFVVIYAGAVGLPLLLMWLAGIRPFRM